MSSAADSGAYIAYRLLYIADCVRYRVAYVAD
jgi:hypothetical protein